MASGTRLRRSGQRQAAPVKARAAPTFDFGLETPVPGEKKLNLDQVYALEHLFQSSPAVQAARTVLAGQLLGGGISLKKDGKEIELKPAFREHLNDVWVKFAGDVLDCFLKWGFAVVCYEEHEDQFRQAGLLAKRRRIEQQGSRAQGVQRREESRVAPQIIPMVPVLGSYEVAYAQGGRAGYKREYYIYSTAPSTANVRDDDARVVVRQHPDQVGNISSPLASVFELGSFVGSLTELALTAEASRARPRVVTQLRHKEQNALSADNLFFDAESRAVQASSESNENQAAARALALQQTLCQVINRMQTRKEPDIQPGSFSGASGSKAPMAPQEIPPSLFCVPKDQELAPNASNPESRGDLEALSRLAIEQFAAALGVPADLVFTGRFAGKSSSQLSLLNITVSQLSKEINKVLTLAYRDIYASSAEDDVGQLALLTSPLAANEEVLQLYNGGLIPVELAIPSVLNSIGVPKDAIDTAVEEALKKKQQEEANTKENQSFEREQRDLTLQERKAGLASGGSGGSSPGGAAQGSSSSSKPDTDEKDS